LTDAGWPNLTPEQEQGYLRLVQNEIEALDGYCRRQLRRHRVARTIVIVSGASVPVLASWSVVPRPVLGGMGAIAAAAEAVAQLYQFQSTARDTLKTRNALERALNRFVMGVGRYAGQQSFSRFVEEIEDIRELADQESYEAWQRGTTPAIGQAEEPRPA
jgi:hypothetical protein